MPVFPHSGRRGLSSKMIGDEDRAPTLADHCWSIQQGALLQTSVNLAIVVCATLDGMGTYPEFEDASFMVIFDIISLSIFLFEMFVKILAQGSRPWLWPGWPIAGCS